LRLSSQNLTSTRKIKLNTDV